MRVWDIAPEAPIGLVHTIFCKNQPMTHKIYNNSIVFETGGFIKHFCGFFTNCFNFSA